MSFLTLDRTWERVLGAGRARARSVLFNELCNEDAYKLARLHGTVLRGGRECQAEPHEQC